MDAVIPTDADNGLAATLGLPGNGGVTLDGNATYDIPLWTPPGRLGLSPSLALSYNSGAGSGLLGVGWALVGLSRIAPCNKTIAVDGEVKGISFSESDALCLDGQRLLPSSDLLGKKSYRTRSDTFVSVIETPAGGGARQFQVYDKSGKISTYGQRTALRRRVAANPNLTNPESWFSPGNYTEQSDGSVAFAWPLERIEDASGNYMSFSYEFLGDEATGYELLPKSISYTHSSVAGAPAHTREVQFEHEPRPDSSSGFVGGVLFATTKRLRSIVSLDLTLGSGAPRIARKHEFAYSVGKGSGRSRLASITEFDGAGVHGASISFTWSDAIAPKWVGGSTSDRIVERFDAGTKFFLDGGVDRKLDAGPNLAFVHGGDVDGDGRDDILYRSDVPVNNEPRGSWRVFGTRAFADGTRGHFDTSTLLPNQAGFPPTNASDGVLVDIDGDGREDFTVASERQPHFANECGTDGGPDGCVTLTGAAPRNARELYFFQSKQSNAFPGFSDRDFALHDQSYPMREASFAYADLNGDGAPDLVKRLPGHALCDSALGSPEQNQLAPQPLGLAMSSSGLPEFPYETPGFAHSPTQALYSIDMLGDGKQRLLISKYQGCGPADARYFALDVGPDASARLTETSLYRELPTKAKYYFLDHNGDGHRDVLAVQQDGLAHIQFGTGIGFSRPTQVSGVLPALWTRHPELDTGACSNPEYVNQIGWNETCVRLAPPDVGVRVVDYNNDGRDDLLLLNGPKTGNQYDNDNSYMSVLLSLPGGGFLRSRVAREIGANPDPTDAKSESLGLVLDWNGDGLFDIGQRFGGSFTVVTQRLEFNDREAEAFGGRTVRAAPRDLLVEIRSKGGAFEQFIYGGVDSRHKNGAPVFVPSNDCKYPQRCVTKGRTLVSERRLDLGGALPETWLYSYQDGRQNVRGEGWLGFRGVDVLNLRTGAVQRTEREMLGDSSVSPHLQRQVTKRTTTTAVAGRIRSEQIVWGAFATKMSQGSDAFFIYPKVKTQRTTDGELLVAHSVETTELNEYGEPVSTLVRHHDTNDGDVEFSTRAIEYWPASDFPSRHWVIARPKSVTETSQVIGVATQNRSVSFSYDERGQLRSIERERASKTAEAEAPSVDRSSSQFYKELVFGRDDLGNVTSVTQRDARGAERTEQFGYDASGVFLERHLNAELHLQRFVFEPRLGVLAVHEDANAVRVSRQYDGFGRIKRSRGVFADDDTWTYGSGEYAPLIVKRERRQSATGGDSVSTSYDPYGRPIVLEAQDFQETPTYSTRAYDSSGRLKEVVDPYYLHSRENERGKTTYSYDVLDRPTMAVRRDGATRSWNYLGRDVTLTTERGNVESKTWDHLGRIVKAVQAPPGDNPTPSSTLLTRFGYGPFGTRVSVTDPSGLVTRTTFDNLGRPQGWLSPETGTSIAAYNGFDELVYAKDAVGTESVVVFDHLGRMQMRQQRSPGASQQWLETTYTWDVGETLDSTGTPTGTPAIGMLGRAASSDSVAVVYAYDSKLRLANETRSLPGASYQVTRTYDEYGRLDFLGYPNDDPSRERLVLRHKYTARGHLQEIERVSLEGPPGPDGTVQPPQVYWRAEASDAAGRLTREAFGNGVVGTYRYDPEGQLRAIIANDASGAPVQRIIYGYDLGGNLSTQYDPLAGLTEDFTYDFNERLEKWDAYQKCGLRTTKYNYHSDGSIRSIEEPSRTLDYQYSATSALPRAVRSVVDRASGNAVAAFEYDAKGNQEALTGERSISFNAHDLPSSIVGPSLRSDFRYDAFNGRASKVISSASGGATVESTHYFPSVFERRLQPTKTTDVFLVRTAGRVVAQIEQSVSGASVTESVAYLHQDRLGSTDTITSAAGKVVDRRKRDPFGSARHLQDLSKTAPDSGSGVRIGYTGHEIDSEFSLVNASGRILDPRFKMFLSIDPIQSTGTGMQGVSGYSYALNNPLRYVDPSGFQVADAHHFDEFHVTGRISGQPQAAHDFEGETIVGDLSTQSSREKLELFQESDLGRILFTESHLAKATIDVVLPQIGRSVDDLGKNVASAYASGRERLSVTPLHWVLPSAERNWRPALMAASTMMTFVGVAALLLPVSGPAAPFLAAAVVGGNGAAAVGAASISTAAVATGAAGVITLMVASSGGGEPAKAEDAPEGPGPRATEAAKDIKFTKEMNSRALPIARGSEIDKIARIKELFGGRTNDWAKMKTWTSGGREIHYYQGPNGVKVGVKLRYELDPF